MSHGSREPGPETVARQRIRRSKAQITAYREWVQWREKPVEVTIARGREKGADDLSIGGTT